MPCQSSNFLRALRTIPEASALGLVFTDVQAVWQSNVPRLVQSFIRFILQQIHVQISPNDFKEKTSRFPSRQAASLLCPSPTKGSPKVGMTMPSTSLKAEDMGKEISAALDQPRLHLDQLDNEEESLFSSLFGMVQEKVTVCTRCKEKKSKNDTVLLCNLMYPDTKEDLKYSFEEIVSMSMCPMQTTPAWCEQCKKYQTTSQTRNLLTLPNILSLNAGMDSAQDLAFWTTQMEHLYNDKAPKTDTEGGKAGNMPASYTEQKPTNPQLPKPCRYGNSCSRPDCKFSHPETEAPTIEPTKVDIGAKCAALGISWVPSEMSLSLHQSGKLSTKKPPPPVSSLEEAEEKESSQDSVLSSKDYELYGICWAILDPATGKAVNIVATVNVGPTYHARIASPVSLVTNASNIHC